jgi:uncharacterized protein YceH (UPF0502 family)
MAEPLTAIERRLLGVLVEKALTSAAPEPLTLNAVVLGASQKSNRDPVMTLEEPEADDGLERLQRKGLVFRITGGRTERWRHNLYDAWKVGKPELALLGELLLRGPQTAAEARSRASRMEPLDHETATAAIKSLVERGFVVWLTPESRRGAVLTHGFHSPEELQRLQAAHSTGVPAGELAPPARAPAPPPVPAPSALESRLPAAFAEIEVLRAEVRELRAAVVSLQQALGVIPSDKAAG